MGLPVRGILVTLASWQRRSVKYGLGWLDEPKREGRRGPGAHEPTEMYERLSWQASREWICPVCQRWELRWKEDLPANFIGITCAGDAALDATEG